MAKHNEKWQDHISQFKITQRKIQVPIYKNTNRAGFATCNNCDTFTVKSFCIKADKARTVFQIDVKK